MRRSVLMRVLQSVVVCGVLCLCLSSTPPWRTYEDKRSTQIRGPVALHHEQTIAVVTYNGPGDTIDRLDENIENTDNRTA